jgi:hypothetical protein
MRIRPEIEKLVELGPLPSENGASVDRIDEYERFYRAISRPITDDEARALVTLFGNDGCFGLASSLMHLIETAPSWPLKDCLKNSHNEWVIELRNRAIRGGFNL